MESALHPLDAVQIKPNKYLVLGIAFSVLLHLACAFFLLRLPSGEPASSPSVTYIDLQAAAHAASMTPPPGKTAPPKLLPEPLEPPLPENPPQAKPSETLPARLAPAPETRVEEERSHTTIGLGLTKGYFKGLGDGETLREGIKEYYQQMLQAINEKWWIDEQLDKRYVTPVVVNIVVARDGEIIGKSILRTSGNARYDNAVLAALTAASPLPPLPASFEGDFFQAPIRLVPPLNLMAW